MAESFLAYPKAAIAQGTGDLVQVTNFNLELTNNAKLKHTLRKATSGAVIGIKEGTVKFDLELDETGPERDYFMYVLTGKIAQLRIKLPGAVTLVCNGVYQMLGLDQPPDDACKMSLTFLCGVAKGS